MSGPGKGKGKGKKKKPKLTKEERLDQALVVSENTTLKTKLHSTVQEAETLKKVKDDLSRNLEKQQGDQADIVEFLKGQIREKEADLRRADEKNLDLTDQLEAQKAEAERKLQQTKDEAKEIQVGLQDELQKAQDELEKLLAFRAIKDELEKEVEELRGVIQTEKKEHKEAMAEIERKSVKEKEGLKKEMVAKIRDIESRFLKMTDNQLEVITKRTILENEGMRTELKYQSRRTENLIVDNERLSNENAKLKHETEMQVSLQQQLAKKNRTLTRQLQVLTAKVEELETAEKARVAEQQISESAEMQMMREALSRQTAELQEAENTLEDAEEEIKELRDQNEEIREEYQRIMDLQNETAVFLMSAMEELKQENAETAAKLREDDELAAVDSAALEPLSWDVMDAAERYKALQFLLSRVNAYGREHVSNMRGPSQASDGASYPRSGSQSREGVRLPPMPSSAGTNGRQSHMRGSTSRMSTPASEFDFSAASVSNYMNFFGAPFPHTPKSRAGRGPPPESRSVGTQTVAATRKYLSDHFAAPDDGGTPFGTMSGRTSQASAVLPDRPWGRRAQVLPLTRSGPDTFMRRGGKR